MTVHDFLKELGGFTQVSRSLGVPVTTVSSWAELNSIPHWRFGDIASLASASGKPVPADFGPRRSRGKTAA